MIFNRKKRKKVNPMPNPELKETMEKELKNKIITYRKMFKVGMEIDSMLHELHKEITEISDKIKCGEY